MRVNRGLLGWGVFFIVLGIVPLAVKNGVVDEAALRSAWQLWPFILIGIGLGLVLERTKFAVLGNLVIAVTFGLMGGAVLAGGMTFPMGVTGCATSDNAARTPFTTSTGALGDRAQVKLQMNCGEMGVASAEGTGWSVAGSSDDGKGPTVNASASRLEVTAPQRQGIGIAQGWRWQVTLPQAGTVDLELGVNAGSARAALAGMHVDGVDVSVNAGDTRLDLGSAFGPSRFDGSVNAGSLSVTFPASSMQGNLSVNAGSAELCVPADVGLRLHTGDNPLGSYDFDGHGLVRNGNTWTSPGYATAPAQIELQVSANLGSITLNPENGCD